MKKFKLTLALTLTLILSLIILCGCNIGGGTEGGNEGEIKVMLSLPEGVSVVGDNPIYVKSGDDAVFTVSVEDNYIIDSISQGSLSGNTITVKGVTKATVIDVVATNVGYDTTAEYRYYFYGEARDTTSVSSGSKVNAGTLVTVTAKKMDSAFLGFSLGDYTTDSGDMLSTERAYTFRLSPELADDSGIIKIYANYKKASAYYYDANGGDINLGTSLASNCDYYSVSTNDSRLAITSNSAYREVYEAVHLFWDDGTFTRDGFVLTEYNTAPDGSGTAYSLGSMYYPDDFSDEASVLYCIWREESSESLFEVSLAQYDTPAGISVSSAADWNNIGYKITKYNGNEDSVVIPEVIGEYPVVAIGSSAFSGKDMTEIVLSKNILAIDEGAFVDCASLETVYYSDSIYYVGDESFDEVTLGAIKQICVNATMAPRFANTDAGAYSVKLSRLLASEGESRVIVIAGSSVYQGLSSAYMEALFGGERTVINFGTTRTTHGLVYLEGMRYLAGENDLILYAPENSTYMMGENEFYWKTARDLESMYNFYRYIDASNYTGIFSALGDFNRSYRYERNPSRYEASYDRIASVGSINEYGEYQNKKRVGLSDYVDVYFITMNERFKSKFEGEWDDVETQISNKDYSDPDNKSWQTVTEPMLVSLVNHAITEAQLSGAEVYFSFCPVDADKLVDEARDAEWLENYNQLILRTYDFDGIAGRCEDYIFAHQYFYDCAFHPNDIGRAYRTYQLYVDICSIYGITPEAYDSVGTDFEGCIFEESPDGKPIVKPDYIN